jgi:biotin synthase
MKKVGDDFRTYRNRTETYSEILERISSTHPVQVHDIQEAFSAENLEQEFCLIQSAHRVRLNNMGKEIHVRGIIEFSNYCRQDCLYCGLRRSNGNLTRYRMSPEQIIKAASKALGVHKFGTFVLQSGEDPGCSAEDIAKAVRAIKEMGSAVTLSVGQRLPEDYELWRKAGADRFLLKFETSDPYLFSRLKPTTTLGERLQCLINLQNLGYQIGTGIILGLPGQTPESVIGDFMLLRKLDPEMVSIGPFIPHPDTPLGTAGANTKTSNPTGLIRATLRAMALSRLMMPLSHIPATTALGVIGRNSREWVELWKQNPKHHDTLSWFDPAQEWNDPRGLALLCGANVIMPDVTPKRFRDSYEIYPGKASSDGEELAAIVKAVNLLIDGLGMFVAPGRGDSPKPGFRHCAFEYTGHNDVTERTDQK